MKHEKSPDVKRRSKAQFHKEKTLYELLIQKIHTQLTVKGWVQFLNNGLSTFPKQHITKSTFQVEPAKWVLFFFLKTYPQNQSL